MQLRFFSQDTQMNGLLKFILYESLPYDGRFRLLSLIHDFIDEYTNFMTFRFNEIEI